MQLEKKKNFKYPLKKVDGKWQRISWDQAVNEISEKMIRLSFEDLCQFINN